MRLVLPIVTALLLVAHARPEGGLKTPEVSPHAFRIMLRERALAQARGDLPPPAPDEHSFPIQVQNARALLRPGDRLGLSRALRSRNPAVVVAALELEREGWVRYSGRLLRHLRDHTRDGRVQNAAGVLLLMREDRRH